MVDSNEFRRQFRKLYDGVLAEPLAKLQQSDQSILRLDWSEIQAADPQTADLILSDPSTASDVAHSELDDAIGDRDMAEDVRFVNLSDDLHLRLSDLRTKHLKTLVALDVEVASVNRVEPWMETAVFMCPGCGDDDIAFGQNFGDIKVPPECPNGCQISKDDFRLNRDRCEYRDFQAITIKSIDSPLEDEPILPCYLLDDRAGRLGKDHEVTIIGEYRLMSFDRQKETQMNTVIKAMAIEGDSGSPDTMSSAAIEEEIKAAIGAIGPEGGDSFGVEQDAVVERVLEQTTIPEKDVRSTLDEMIDDDQNDIAAPSGRVFIR